MSYFPAVVLQPATVTQNLLQPLTDVSQALILRNHSLTQTAQLLQWQLSDGTNKGGVGPGGSLSAQGLALNANPKTANYTTLGTDFYVPVDATAGAVTITLAPANTGAPQGNLQLITKIDSSANPVTVQRAGADTINGGTALVLTAGQQSMLLISDGASAWRTAAVPIPISSPGTGTASERFGALTTAAMLDATALGNSAAATGLSSTVIGALAVGSASGSCVLGVGGNSGHTGAICLGANAASTAIGQLVIGSAAYPTTDLYLGQGVSTASPAAASMNATGGSGTNNAGAAITLAGGKGTGNAAGGSIFFATSPAGTAGSSVNALTTRVTIDGAAGWISCPGSGGASSERFGNAASATGANATAVGASAFAAAQCNAFGNGASAGAGGGNQETAVGNSAVANATWATMIGSNSSGTGVGAVGVGFTANNAFNYSVALGAYATPTAARQFVAGGSAANGTYITDVYIGTGPVDPTPNGVTYHGSGGSGTNIAGASLTLAGGQGTGNAAGGAIVIQGSPAGASGAGLNALVTLATHLATGQTAIGSQTPTALLHLAPGAAAAGFSPLKLTTGPLLTTPEAGAIEFLTPTLYQTPVTTRRSFVLGSNSVTADTTVANTTTETVLFTGTIAGGEMAAGKMFRVVVAGRYSALGTDTITFRFKQGGTTFLTLTPAAAALSNTLFQGEFTVVCRTTGATGTVISKAWLLANNLLTTGADTGTHTLDTTVGENITVTVQWSAASASDTLTLTQAIMEVIN